MRLYSRLSLIGHGYAVHSDWIHPTGSVGEYPQISSKEDGARYVLVHV
jgi:hypothetical protein